MKSCSTGYQGENGYNITFSDCCIRDFYCSLFPNGSLWCRSRAHLIPHPFSHCFIKRVRRCPVFPWQITPLFLPPCLPSSLSPFLFRAWICLLSTTLRALGLLWGLLWCGSYTYFSQSQKEPYKIVMYTVLHSIGWRSRWHMPLDSSVNTSAPHICTGRGQLTVNHVSEGAIWSVSPTRSRGTPANAGKGESTPTIYML